MTIDEIRARYPHLGVAVYALEPNGVVTVEVHAPGGWVRSWRGQTAAEAIAQAFPPEAVSPQPSPVEPEEDVLA